MSKSTKSDERTEAIVALRKIIKPGDTVYTVLRHVSASGMSRRIDLYAIRKNELVYLTGYAAKALDMKRHPSKDGLTVGGCGMDMGFAIVYDLSRTLFPKGFKVTAERGRNGITKGSIDPDGGYALKHRWI
jgi:hypothetical protein